VNAAAPTVQPLDPKDKIMLIGQTILAPTSDTLYYSPWMPRQGDAFTVVIQVLQVSGTLLAFNCDVETKNNEESDSDATMPGSTMAITATAGAVSTQAFSRAKELVRYVFTLKGSGAQWVHFRSNPPIWQPN